MKKYFFIVLILMHFIPATARHVAGGELYYQFLSTNGAVVTYQITLRLFRDCNSNGPQLQNERVTVGVYKDGLLYDSVYLPLVGGVRTISMNTAAFPCLVGDVNVCYQVAIYTSTITVPVTTNGYTLARIGCCRIDRISNSVQPNNLGSNYITRIPGTATLPIGNNSSPKFNERDTALVCANKRFTLDFGAIDQDNDSLTYSFCDAYTSSSGSNNAPPPTTLSLTPLPYLQPFNGSMPLGPGVSINAATGIISGTAPGEGQYVVSVCITEWRKGVPITEHRKDFILKIQNCDFIEAVLPDKTIKCDDNIVHFENESSSSAITEYLWDFGDPLSPATSKDATPTHVYADTGRYLAHLYVKGPKGCEGVDSTIVLVYPGFKPAFNFTGNCFQNPYLFFDATTTVYGVVDSWRWNFGDISTSADTAIAKNAQYKYKTPSNTTISLVVTNSKGCIDSISQAVVIRDKPMIALPFKDTLICSIDSLPIKVPGPGVFSWQPNNNILFANTANPIVFPKDTTQYIVTVHDNGCVNTDTVTVNVLDFITVQLAPDTTICKTDTIVLNPISHALAYQWTPANTLTNPNTKYPTAKPLTNTIYKVLANLGKCQATAEQVVKVAPYPQANVITPDTAICFGARIQLQGSYTGTSFSWAPANALINPRTLNPIVAPARNTLYTFTVADSVLGCPKSVTDSLLVMVVPPIVVNAGRDTSIVVDQELQMLASVNTGTQFLWTPPMGLSSRTIYNPIVRLGEDIDSIKYRLRVTGPGGCYGEDDIVVRVYKTAPEIFVPSGFTPNGDGRNDVLRPMAVGISRLRYYRVFNRLGQLLFSTTELGKGWDGTYNGVKQPSGTYVYMTEGADHTGKTVFRKGTSVLIR